MINDKEQLPTQDEIAARAYELYLARGGKDGQAIDDWLIAEEDLRQKRAKESTPLRSKTVAAGRRGRSSSDA